MKHRKFIKIINIVLIAVFVMAVFNIGKIYYDYNKADNLYEVIQDEYVATKDVESNSEATQGNEDQPPKEIEPPIAIDFDALLDRRNLANACAETEHFWRNNHVGSVPCC